MGKTVSERMTTEQDNYKTLIEQTEATRWQPGQSGNPKGRPKNSITALLKKYLDADDEFEKQAIVKQWVSLAQLKGAPGQMSAIKEILDRVEGKVPETHKVEGELPIQITFNLRKGETERPALNEANIIEGEVVDATE